MLLALKKLFTGETSCVSFDDQLDLRDTEISGVQPFASPVHLTGQAVGNSEGVSLSMVAVFDYCVPCDRCAVPVKSKKEYRFTHELVRELHQEDNDQYVLVEGDELDLGELARADILLELPTKNLCKPDCKGLCPKCGTNLNSGSCECDTRQIDSRLEILKQLIDGSD
ncbi:MAG: DUF177 domain-containing protein [Oscillospiraceae bacterium]|nr:DUF177 domain-containing protein [Oscillospiraceae bacterium]